jgi:hypothetical protein
MVAGMVLPSSKVRDFDGVLDDMVVRDHITIGRDNETRALRLSDMSLEVMAAFFLAEMFEEALEQVAGRNMRHLAFLAGISSSDRSRLADSVRREMNGEIRHRSIDQIQVSTD